MALTSKLLDERVVNLAKEMLKKIRNNAYVSKKLQAVIAAKESYINEQHDQNYAVSNASASQMPTPD